MDTSRLGRVVGSFVAMVAFAIVFGIALRVALVVAGLPTAAAMQISVPVSITIALVLADAYTPLGRGPIPGLREEPRALALDLVLAAVVTFVVAGALVALNVSVPGGDVVVVIVGIIAGYGTFFYRNREHYRSAGPQAP